MFLLLVTKAFPALDLNITEFVYDRELDTWKWKNEALQRRLRDPLRPFLLPMNPFLFIPPWKDPVDLDEYYINPSYLTSSHISESTHQIVISHFQSLNVLELVATSGGGYGGRRGYFDIFFDIYLRYCDQSFAQPLKGLLKPPITPLAKSLELRALFYLQNFLPYIKLFKGLVTSMQDYAYSKCPYLFWISVFEINSPFKSLTRRYRCGLMREAQFELIETVLQKDLEQVSGLLEIDLSQRQDKKDYLSLYDELARAINRNHALIANFLASEHFRSERLEYLLLKYTKEEDINWELVRALEQKQRACEEKERREEDAERQRQCLRPMGPETLDKRFEELNSSVEDGADERRQDKL